MNVLMLSGDRRLLEEGSDAARRLALQKGQVDRLDVFVWPQPHRSKDVCRAALAERYDVITAQDPFWRGLLAWRISRRTGAKLNLQLHADLAGQSFVKRVLARFTLPRADSVRAVSERVAAEARAFGAKRVSVLPIFTDLGAFRRVVREPHPQPTILWVGRFEAEKDPLAAIEILKEVREKTEAKLVMLGDGSCAVALRAAARGLPIEFPGWQDPKSYLAIADVVLSTSPYESYGASIVEALAAGVPVVAPDVGVAREAGAVVVSRTELADAVARVLIAGVCGELKMPILDAEAWAKRWRESLV